MRELARRLFFHDTLIRESDFASCVSLSQNVLVERGGCGTARYGVGRGGIGPWLEAFSL